MSCILNTKYRDHVCTSIYVQSYIFSPEVHVVVGFLDVLTGLRRLSEGVDLILQAF
jgi:hypothetical protein